MSKYLSFGLLLVMVVAIGCSGHRASPKAGSIDPGSTEAEATKSGSAAERLQFRRVRPAVAFEIMRDSPKVPVIDLRPDDRFCGPAGHIRWSWNLPIETLEARLKEIEFLKERTFLVYCDSEECAHEGMGVFAAAGFEDAMLIDGGIHAWRKAGFGTVDVPEGEMSPDGLVRGPFGSVQ